MPSTKEIKNRINNVNNTRKITNAMYLIASTKVKRAKADLERTRPYFEMIRSEIRRVFRAAGSEADSRFFFPEGAGDGLPGTRAILCFTADKGLAGAYNQNVIKETSRLMREHGDYRLFIIGEVGRRYFRTRDAEPDRIDMDFQSSVVGTLEPSLDRARSMALAMDEGISSGRYSEIYAVYTDFAGGLSGGTAKAERLLPFHRAHFDRDAANGENVGAKAGAAGHGEQGLTGNIRAGENAPGADAGKPEKDPEYEILPSASAIMDGLVLNYLTGYIYSIMVDSFCCEQNARMMAMDAANQNAEDLLSELSLEYNHVRQAAITREITEISAGAKAKKRNG